MSKDEMKGNEADFVFGEEEAKEEQVIEETTVSEEPASEAPAEKVEEPEKESSKGKIFARYKTLEKGTPAYEVFDWLRTICIGVLAGICIVVFLVQRDDVYGSSMMPTLSQGDIVFTQKLSTYFHNYKRGDILILDGSNMEGYTRSEYLVKRLIGLPGETVRIENGNVYIKPVDSDEFFLLQENYLPEGTKTIMMEDGIRKGYNEITLGENEYFCLGDNRPVSNE